MSDISKINVLGTEYDIKDATARNMVLQSGGLNSRKFIFIGDSYGAGYSPDGSVIGWDHKVVANLGLNADKYVIKNLGGSGFCANTTFTQLLMQIAPDDEVTDIIVCGGYNDRSYVQNDITSGVTSFCSYAKANFPNARVYVGNIGCSTLAADRLPLAETIVKYYNACAVNGAHYISGSENCITDANGLSSDGFHPNQFGQDKIATTICNAITGNTVDNVIAYTNITINPTNKSTGITFGGNTVGATVYNGFVQFTSQNVLTFSTNGLTYNGGGSMIELGELVGNLPVNGSHYGLNNIGVEIMVREGAGTYYTYSATLRVVNNKLMVGFLAVNDAHNGYQNFSDIEMISIMPFTGVFSKMFA